MSIHSVKLLQLGQSTVMTIPPELLDAMGVVAGMEVGMTVINGLMVIEPNGQSRPLPNKQQGRGHDLTSENHDGIENRSANRGLLDM